MPDYQPIAVSRRHDRKRPQPIPSAVKQAIELMVMGRADDEECRPLDVVEAAAAVGLQGFVLRRHLEKPHVRAALLAERRRFLTEIVASNPAALKRVRDTSPNGMVTVAASRQLEEMHKEEGGRSTNAPPTAGVFIRIISQQAPQPAGPVIDVTSNAPMAEDASAQRR